MTVDKPGEIVRRAMADRTVYDAMVAAIRASGHAHAVGHAYVSRSIRDDKFHAIGSCFARGLEWCLQKNGIAVESAAPEFSKLQPAKEGVSALGFTSQMKLVPVGFAFKGHRQRTGRTFDPVCSVLVRAKI